MVELIEEIESICYSGTRPNLGYFLDEMMEKKRQEEIYDYFMSASTDNIVVAMKDLGDELTEKELRLVRLKFISEVASQFR